MSSFDEHDAFEGASLSARAMAARPMPYLDELNPAQREAVETLDGPVLMLAGAGTGKTKALMARVAHLIMTRRAQPNEILAVTFTNKAAREMKERLGKTPFNLPAPIKWMGTFHSLSVKILRRHAELVGSSSVGNAVTVREVGAFDQGPVPNPNIGNEFADRPELHLKSNFSILDSDDQQRVLKQLIRANHIDDKRWTARHLAGLIDGWKNRALTPDKLSLDDAEQFNNMAGTLYAQYQTRLLELNACDFGDLILHVVTIFQKHTDLLEQYRRWFRYVLVDEYQDTNVAQYLWLRLLAGGHKNICCVGDDDQSIYGWRGAEVGNILRFEKDFPGAHVVRLEQNYRSTEHILAAASNIIQGNEDRLGKTLWTDRKDGEKVRLIGHWDGEEEARWIGEEIESMQRGTRGMGARSLDDMAILVRASHQMRAFEDRFLTIGLPYRVIGGPRFYERLEIRDAMAYFRLVVSPDDDLAFERIVNTPKRGLGNVAQQKIQACARTNGVSLIEGARILLEEKGLGGKGGKELQLLVDNLARWRGDMLGPRIQVQLDDDAVLDDGPIQGAPTPEYGTPDVTHIELAEVILDESGYTTMWQNDKTPEAPGRLENLKELVKALENFENLQGFLEHVSLIMDNESDEAEPKVTIMTLHGAKGLEFPAVFLPGWEDGLFPSQRSMDESGLKGLEEERRLAYVGITRAEELCTISFTGNRLVYGQWQSQMPSRFIDELPEAHVEVLTPPGLYGGGFGAASRSGAASGIEARAESANVYNSPGWKRMQTRAGQSGGAKPKTKGNPIIDLEAVASFSVGDRVFHQKFGYGFIMEIEADKLGVDFEKAGLKKVVARFVTAPDDIPF